MKPLLSEYRETMNADVLHDWAKDMIALVQSMERKLQTAKAAKALANRRADDLQRGLEVARRQTPVNLVVGKCGTATCLREASRAAAAEELLDASASFAENLLEGEFVSTTREERFLKAAVAYRQSKGVL